MSQEITWSTPDDYFQPLCAMEFRVDPGNRSAACTLCLTPIHQDEFEDEESP